MTGLPENTAATAPTCNTRRSTWREAAVWTVALALYVAVASAVFGPVLTRLGTVFIGDGGDNLLFVWNAWWASQSLLRGHNPYFCPVQFAPFGVPTFLHTLSLIPSLVIALLARATSMPMAYNLVVIGLFAVAGLCAFALARYVVRDVPAALAGGVAFMLCPYLASKSTGHFNLQCAALLPLYTLCLLVAVEHGGQRRKWALSAVFVLILLSNIHTAIFAVNVTVWYFVYCGVRGGRWGAELRRFWKVLRPATVIGAMWAAAAAYYAVRYGVVPKRFGSPVYCPEPLSFLLPLHLNSRWRGVCAPAGDWGAALGSIELAVYLGWLVLPMAIAGWVHLRRTSIGRFMLIVFLCSFALAAGQKLQWKRQIVKLAGATVYLPMGFYRYIPVLGAVGQSGRYMVIGYMAMGVGVAGLVAAVRQRRGPWAAWLAAGAAIALTGVDYAFRPVVVGVPTCPIPPGEGRVLDPRLGNPTGLYYQTIHGRELVGGYVARIPVKLRTAYQELPGIGWLFQPPDRRGKPPSPAELRTGLDALAIRYVCVDAGVDDRRVLEAAGLRVVHEDRWGVTLTRGPPAGPTDSP